MMHHVPVEPDGLTEQETSVLGTVYQLVWSKAEHIPPVTGL